MVALYDLDALQPVHFYPYFVIYTMYIPDPVYRYRGAQLLVHCAFNTSSRNCHTSMVCMVWITTIYPCDDGA